MAVGITLDETLVAEESCGKPLSADDEICVDTKALVGISDVDDVNNAAWLMLLVGIGTMDVVGVSLSAVKLALVGVAVGEFPIVSFVVMSEAVVVGDELVAVLRASSVTTSLDVKGLCVESTGKVLVDEERGTLEALMEIELALRMVVDERFGVSREVEETPAKELDIATRN